jgi:hypothetical protein
MSSVYYIRIFSCRQAHCYLYPNFHEGILLCCISICLSQSYPGVNHWIRYGPNAMEGHTTGSTKLVERLCTHLLPRNSTSALKTTSNLAADFYILSPKGHGFVDTGRGASSTCNIRTSLTKPLHMPWYDVVHTATNLSSHRRQQCSFSPQSFDRLLESIDIRSGLREYILT